MNDIPAPIRDLLATLRARVHLLEAVAQAARDQNDLALYRALAALDAYDERETPEQERAV